jgi:hypothetical protein
VGKKWVNKITEGQKKGKRWQIIKNMINLPTIQILIHIKETLAQYYAKVKEKNYDLLQILDIGFDFHTVCPICGGENCARFIKYYTRGVIDENGTYYKDFPIARYLCERRGGQSEVSHKTFSLLPYQLAPYTKYSVPFIIKMLEVKHIEGLSISKVQDYAANFGKDEILPISSDQLSDFKQLIHDAINKIMSTEHYHEVRKKISLMGSEQERLIAFIEFAQAFECLKTDPLIRGPCGLPYDFYLNEGGYCRNAPFLFGTPSQFR